MKFSRSTKKLMSQLILENLYAVKFTLRSHLGMDETPWIFVYTDGYKIYKEDGWVVSSAINHKLRTNDLYDMLFSYVKKEYPGSIIYDAWIMPRDDEKLKLNRKHPWLKGHR